MGMPKIVWLDQEQVKEILVPERGFISLGRGRDNHIILSDPRVSRVHARLVCGPHGCLLKDMTSASGVHVNGDPVNSRFLQDGDIIRIGHHVLEYLAEERWDHRSANSPVSTPTFKVNKSPKLSQAEGVARKRRAFLRYTAGSAVGHIQTIDRPLMPIGDPDGYYAAISRRTSGCYLLNLGKGLYAQLNGEPVSGAGARLHNGDTIRLGEEEMVLRVFDETEH
jgi:pSer/pThr/pTyr-binding forkhead associated (FHA) protein